MPQVPAPILSRPEVRSHILADNNNDEARKKHHEHPPHPHDHHHLGMPHWLRIVGPMPNSNITMQDIEILLHQLLSSPQPHRITSNSIHNVIPEIGREPWFRFLSLRVSWPNREPLADLYYGGTGENVNAEHITTRPPEHTTITPKVTPPPRHVMLVIWPPRHENNGGTGESTRAVEVRPETRPVVHTPYFRPYFRYNFLFLPFTHSYNPVIRPEIRPVVHTPYFRYNFLPFTHSYNPVIPKQPPIYHVVFDHNLLTL